MVSSVSRVSGVVLRAGWVEEERTCQHVVVRVSPAVDCKAWYGRSGKDLWS